MLKTSSGNPLNYLYYKNNDTFEINGIYFLASGFLSTGKTTITFSFPVEKRLDKIKNIIVNSLIVQIRHADGGYIAQNVELSTLGTMEVDKSSANVITITLTLKQASTYTNNCPLSVAITKCKITFSE